MKAITLTTKFLLISAVCCLVLIARAHKAYAHFPETAGNLTAILHVEPDDYPPAASPQTIYFIFSDLSGKFKLADCSCDLSISEKGQPLYFAPLTPPTNQLSIYSTRGNAFTFPNQDTYQIRLAGTPLGAGDFPAFSLNWNFRVGPPVSTSDTSYETIAVYFVVMLGVFLILGAGLFLLT